MRKFKMTYPESRPLLVTAPTTEIYLNGPSTVASEDEIETDIYVDIAAARR